MAKMDQFYRFLSPHTVLLVTTGKDEEKNIITIAWHMPVSLDPPLHAVSIRPSRHSKDLIEKYREWVVNVPTLELLEKAHDCGTVSGRTVDKFKDNGLTAIPSEKVSVPSIQECPINIECRFNSQHAAGDHDVFVGQVVHVRTVPDKVDGTFFKKGVSNIGHMGGNDYCDRWGNIHRSMGRKLP